MIQSPINTELRTNFDIDPVVLEKSGLINECTWKQGGGLTGCPHTMEK